MQSEMICKQIDWDITCQW